MSIQQNLEHILSRIRAAELRAGRPAGSVRLVAVSKTFPAEDVKACHDAGQRIFGENKVQEGLAKIPSLPPDTEWHLIGPLQRNKVRQVVGKVALIQSVGSMELLREIEKEAAKQGLRQDILLEVNIGGEEAKSGFAPEETEAAAVLARELPHVRVRGLMTIPPVETVPHGNLVYFEKMHRLYVDINGKIYDNKLEYISMGMSGDFADAIRAGSNMVRVGTAIFGARDYTK